MSQGLKIADLPSVTKENIDVGDLFLFEEKVSSGVYSTKQLDSSYILKLKTEASNISTNYDEVNVYTGTTTNTTGSSVLNFRSLKAGDNISLSQQISNITINANVNGENIEADTTNNVGSYFGKNQTSSYLQFKNFSGLNGLEATADNNKIYIKKKENHYFFIPSSPLNLNVNQTLLDYYLKFSDILTDPTYDIEWYSGIFTCNLQSSIDDLPIDAKNSIINSTNCLALLRIDFEANTGGNSVHYLETKSYGEQDWVVKHEINPRDSWHTLWENKTSITTTVGFKSSNSLFDLRIRTDQGQKETSYWKTGIKVRLEGFFV
jgi:hypothetical protein